MTFHALVPRRSRGHAHPALRAFWPAEFGRFFDEAFGADAGAASGFTPRVDVEETNEAYLVRADLPGLDEKDIQVSLEDGLLTIQGRVESEKKEERKGWHYSERSTGSFHRAIELPADVDADKVTATYKKGVLTVSVPKVPEAKPEVRTIPVKTS
jgi:HSP20 family protein